MRLNRKRLRFILNASSFRFLSFREFFVYLFFLNLFGVFCMNVGSVYCCFSVLNVIVNCVL